ncbi:MAG: hypothetical protein VX015_05005 [Planctomycetota bacterium]|nr:hypothetical protein [Planctomycetota bacterium]
MTDERATDDPLPRTVHALEARAVLGDVAREGRLVPEPERRWFEGVDGDGRPLRVHPALVSPIAAGCRDLLDHLDAAPEELGPHLVVLLQAGRCSMGWFDGGEAVETKSFSRYVVRGKGRAQPTHLATKGKSRYGSRLRLQNARALTEETVERMQQWWDEFGPADAVLVNAPVRLWASLFEADPPPPFGPDGAASGTPVRRIPRDIPRPTSELVVRTWRFCCYLRLERPDA